MTVYVESNFVLEQALQQEQCDACDAIVDLAASGRISLVVPAFSLAEPHQALELKEKARNRLSNELQWHISELGRSRAYRAVPDDFGALVSILIRSAERERESLQDAIAGLLKTVLLLYRSTRPSSALPANSRPVWECLDRTPSFSRPSLAICKTILPPRVAS